MIRRTLHPEAIHKARNGEPSADVTLSIDCNGVLNMPAFGYLPWQRNQVDITEPMYAGGDNHPSWKKFNST
jgi:hypothetical protein